MLPWFRSPYCIEPTTHDSRNCETRSTESGETESIRTVQFIGCCESESLLTAFKNVILTVKRMSSSCHHEQGSLDIVIPILSLDTKQVTVTGYVTSLTQVMAAISNKRRMERGFPDTTRTLKTNRTLTAVEAVGLKGRQDKASI